MIDCTQPMQSEENLHPSPMPTPVMTTNRLETFSDGVFAIVITLLVLDLKLPMDARPLGERLHAIWPQIAAYAASFIIVGMTWVGHHNLFHLIKRVDKTLMWLNLAELIVISFIPFPTAILGLSPTDPAAIRFFAAILALGGLAYNVMWCYASAGHRLIHPHLDPALIRLQWLRSLSFPIAFTLAFLLTWVSPLAALVVLVVVPVQYILPSRFDPRHYKA